MADRSSTYSLNWDGAGYAKGVSDAATKTEVLATAMGKATKAAKGAGSALGSSGKAAAGGVAAVGAVTKEAKDKTEGFSAKMFALTKVFKLSEADANAFMTNGALPVSQILTALGGAALGAAAAFAVVAAAAVAATVAFVAYALAAATAARANNLLLQASTQSAIGAELMEKQTAKLALVTGLGSAKLNDIALGMSRAGVAGNHLRNAFNAVAIATSAMGEGAGGKLRGIAEEAVKTGRIVLSKQALLGTGVGLEDVADALAKKAKVSFTTAKAALQSGTVKVGAALEALDAAVSKKLGGIAKKQAIGLDVQLSRLHDNVGKLFAGLNMEPLLEGMADFLSIFDQSTVSGQSLKAALQAIAIPLIDGLKILMPLGKAFFQGMIIGALQVAIVLLKVRNYLRDTFGGSKGGIDAVGAALTAGKVAAIGMAIGLGVVLLALVGIVAIGALLAAVFLGPIVAVGYGLYKLGATIVGAFTTAKTFLMGLDFGAVASNLIAGLVNGITSGAAWVIDAIKGLGTSAIKALESVLRIGSPSKAFAQLGAFTAQGFAQGVDAGAPEVNRSVSELVQTPAARASSGGKTGGGVKIDGGVHVHLYGVKGAEEMNDSDFLDRVARAIERVVWSSGGALPEPEGTS